MKKPKTKVINGFALCIRNYAGDLFYEGDPVRVWDRKDHAQIHARYAGWKVARVRMTVELRSTVETPVMPKKR
jgi:S-adenosylhomocysteine hydrolase